MLAKVSFDNSNSPVTEDVNGFPRFKENRYLNDHVEPYQRNYTMINFYTVYDKIKITASPYHVSLNILGFNYPPVSEDFVCNANISNKSWTMFSRDFCNYTSKTVNDLYKHKCEKHPNSCKLDHSSFDILYPDSYMYHNSIVVNTKTYQHLMNDLLKNESFNFYDYVNVDKLIDFILQLDPVIEKLESKIRSSIFKRVPDNCFKPDDNKNINKQYEYFRDEEITKLKVSLKHKIDSPSTASDLIYNEFVKTALRGKPKKNGLLPNLQPRYVDTFNDSFKLINNLYDSPKFELTDGCKAAYKSIFYNNAFNNIHICEPYNSFSNDQFCEIEYLDVFEKHQIEMLNSLVDIDDEISKDNIKMVIKTIKSMNPPLLQEKLENIIKQNFLIEKDGNDKYDYNNLIDDIFSTLATNQDQHNKLKRRIVQTLTRLSVKRKFIDGKLYWTGIKRISFDPNEVRSLTEQEINDYISLRDNDKDVIIEKPDENFYVWDQ
jgi:hypothetical protein